MDELDREIKKTKEYGGQFGVSYDPEEITKRLISGRVYSKKLLQKKLISDKQGVTPKSKYTVAKLAMVENYARKLARVFPDILLIAVTGSVAAGYCKQNDDIDLMIITRNNRLWLNRLLLRIYVGVNKIPHRKFGLKENKDDLCFNLWIEEGVMRLPIDKQTLRNAMDTILMVPVLNKNKTYENFLVENDWVGKFVANGYQKILNGFDKDERKPHSRIDVIAILNWLVFWPQWWYMKHKISTEVVGLRLAFFHPNDRIRYAREDNR